MYLIVKVHTNTQSCKTASRFTVYNTVFTLFIYSLLSLIGINGVLYLLYLTQTAILPLTKVLLLLKRNHRGDLQSLDSAPTMHHVHLPVTSAYLLAANGNYDARELNSDGNYVPENSASG